MDIISILVAIISVGLGMSSAAAAYKASREAQKRSGGETINDRVQRLTTSLQEATSLIGNIESEIKARSTLATQLQQDLDRYNQLVALKKPEVEAIAQLLRGELKKEGRSTFWKSFLINFLFFILGAGASLLIAKIIR